MCLALPWEVLERVIDHSAGHTRTLYSLALTCRDLHPRSTNTLYRHLQFKKRDQIFDLCDVLRTKPHLQACVESVLIPIDEFSPHPLLRLLPHLSEIKIVEWGEKTSYHGSFLPSPILRSCHQFGQHIQSLFLSWITFRSLSGFAEILLSFPRIHTLSCINVKAEKDDIVTRQPEGIDWERPWSITRRLSQRLHLRTLHIEPFRGNMVLNLLAKAQNHSLVSLTGDVRLERKDSKYNVNELLKTLSPSDWVQLTSTTWKMSFEAEKPKPRLVKEHKSMIQLVINILEGLRPQNLREVTIDFVYYSIDTLVVGVLSPTTELCAELEKQLIMFPMPTISFTPGSFAHHDGALNIGRHPFWMSLLSRFFPVLAERHALKLNAKLWNNVGHDNGISTPIVISTDGQWAATGSYDRTIIIWDVDSQCISQEWFIESSADFLAFSPDSRYIMSVGIHALDGCEEATIWDLHQGGCRVRSLKGEGYYHFDATSGVDTCCAGSPDGTWVAAGYTILDLATFRRLHLHTTWEGAFVVVLFTARTIFEDISDLSRIPEGDCWTWNVDSGKLHRSHVGHTKTVNAAAFDPRGTRIITGSSDFTIRVWDVESGEQLLVLPEPMKRESTIVELSDDGRMVLSRSYSNDLVTSKNEATVWNASSRTLLTTLSRLYGDTPNHEYYKYTACFSPCGNYLASASSRTRGKVLLWRTSDWSCIGEMWAGGESEVTRIAISPDGKVLCCGTRAGAVFFGFMQDLVSAS